MAGRPLKMAERVAGFEKRGMELLHDIGNAILEQYFQKLDARSGYESPRSHLVSSRGRTSLLRRSSALGFLTHRAEFAAVSFQKTVRARKFPTVCTIDYTVTKR